MKHKVCRGTAFQNEGDGPRFETEKFPSRTFVLLQASGVCSPGVEAEIFATVDVAAGVATFHSEVE